jgi:hypothetical protein
MLPGLFQLISACARSTGAMTTLLSKPLRAVAGRTTAASLPFELLTGDRVRPEAEDRPAGAPAERVMVPVAGGGYHQLDPAARGKVHVLLGREPWLSASA